jgi:light-independent protochlorophyllide reductase subunit N
VLPATPAPRERCWSSARWPMWSRTSSAGCSTNGHRPGALPAAARATALPPVGPNTRFLLAQPFLADTARRWRSAAPPHLPRRSRSGVEGTTLWLKAAADASASIAARFRRVTAPARERARAALARYRAELAGKRIFFFPDSQLEIPLARFLSRELGMQLVEVGTPYLHRQHLAEELALLPAGTRSAKARTSTPARSLPRARPDLVVCGLGLANPLEAEG